MAEQATAGGNHPVQPAVAATGDAATGGVAPAAATGAAVAPAAAATATTATAAPVVPVGPPPVFTWRIPDFARMVRQERIWSEEFTMAAKKWKMLCMPHPDWISIYLKCCEKMQYPNYPRVKFKFNLLHPNPIQSRPNDSEHEFSPSEDDRGFYQYVPTNEVGHYLIEGAFIMEVQIEDAKRPPNEFGEQPDFKPVVGFVGLKNQGATCYMNSLLQALYNLPQFRRAVYTMPTETEAKTGSKSIALALQRVFYGMQFSRHSVTTKQLTSSFGWDSADAFMQHDVQEFSRVLCDSLEENMKGTIVDGTMNRLFEGKSQMYIECVNVPYKSERVESFLDLALNVKGCKTLEASFKQYIEVEKMEGENQYRAEKHGLQDARKGCRFLKFPPILQLQLKRFEFDPHSGQMVKVNDKFEFPSILDLNPYLAESAARDEKDPNIYYLHSVLVHSGSVHGGHYYSYIRPITPTGDFAAQQWYKFDDESVYRVSEQYAVNGSFGGEVEQVHYQWGRKYTQQVTRHANAYMLIYLRKSECEALQKLHAETLAAREKLTEDEKKATVSLEEEGSIPRIAVEPPHHLVSRFKQEEAAALARAEEARIAHQFTEIKVLCENDLVKGGPCAIELTLEERNSQGLIKYRPVDKSYKVKKDNSLTKWAEEAEKLFGIPVARQQWWLMSMRENATIRPNNWHVTPDRSFEDCEIKRQKCHFYLRDSDYDQYGSPDGNKLDEKNSMNKEGDRSLILLKYFDIKQQKLLFVGSLIMMKAMNMQEVVKMVKNLLVAKKFIDPEEKRPLRPVATAAPNEVKEAPKTEAAKKEAEARLAAEHEAIWQGIGVRAYEEEKAITYKIIEEKDPRETLLDLRFRHGDMIVFQQIYSPEEVQAFKDLHKASYSSFQEKLQGLQRAKEEKEQKAKEEKARIEAEARAAKGEAPKSEEVKATPATAATAPAKTDALKPPAKQAVDTSPGALAAALDAGKETAVQVDVKKEDWLVSMWEEVKPDFYETIKDYVRFMADRILVHFRRHPWPIKKDGADFSLELAKTMKYDDLVTLLGAQLKCDPMKIRLRREKVSHYEEGADVSVLPRDRETTLVKMIAAGKEPVLYYEMSPYSWLELETKRVLEVNFLHINLHVTKLELLVPKDGKFSDIGEMVKERMSATLLIEDKDMWLRNQSDAKDDHDRARRVLEEKAAKDGTIASLPAHEEYKQPATPEFAAPRVWRALRYVFIDDTKRPKRICMNDMPIAQIPDPDGFEKFSIRIEEELPGEQTLAGGERAVWAAQYAKGQPTPRIVGPVFAFIIKPTEKFGDTKLRLQRRLNVADDRWAKYNFCQLTRYYDRDTIKDHICLTSLDWSGVERGDMILGIEDPDNKGRNDRGYQGAYKQRELKIYNKNTPATAAAAAKAAAEAAAAGQGPVIAAGNTAAAPATATATAT